MTMRLKKGWEVGDAGAVYEFEIKLPRIEGISISNESFEIEAQDSIRDFVRDLKKRYKWVGDVYQTGRSGGWLAVEDKSGRATRASLKTIDTRVKNAMRDFVAFIEDNYQAPQED